VATHGRQLQRSMSNALMDISVTDSSLTSQLKSMTMTIDNEMNRLSVDSASHEFLIP